MCLFHLTWDQTEKYNVGYWFFLNFHFWHFCKQFSNLCCKICFHYCLVGRYLFLMIGTSVKLIKEIPGCLCRKKTTYIEQLKYLWYRLSVDEAVKSRRGKLQMRLAFVGFGLLAACKTYKQLLMHFVSCSGQKKILLLN